MAWRGPIALCEPCQASAACRLDRAPRIGSASISTSHMQLPPSSQSAGFLSAVSSAASQALLGRQSSAMYKICVSRRQSAFSKAVIVPPMILHQQWGTKIRHSFADSSSAARASPRDSIAACSARSPLQVRLMPSRQCRPTENPFWYGPSQGPPGQRKDQRARSARASGARAAAEGEHPPIPQPLGPSQLSKRAIRLPLSTALDRNRA